MDVERDAGEAGLVDRPVTSRSPAIGALDPLPGLVWAFAITPEGGDAIGRHELEQHLRTVDGGDHGAPWFWLHFDLADRRTQEVVLRLLGHACRCGVSIPSESVVRTFLHQRVTPQLHFDEGMVYGTLADEVIDIDGAKSVSGTMQIIVGPRMLLTGRRMHLLRAEAMRELARENRLGDRPAAAFETLVRMSTEQHATTLQEAAHSLDEVEDLVLEDAATGERNRLSRIRNTLVRTSRDLAALSRLHERVYQEMLRETGTSDGMTLHAPDAAGYRGVDFVSLLEHLNQIDGQCLALIDRARLLQEEISDQLTVQTNRQLYVLSILTAMLVPPTIVTGLLGMNTGGLPLTQDTTGFWQALGWCLAASVGVLSVMVATGVIDRPRWSWRRHPGRR